MIIHTSDASGVNTDLVSSTMDLLGYQKKGWRWVYLLTFANIVLMGYAMWLALPAMIALPCLTILAGAAFALGGRLFYLGSTYAEHTLVVRNALERRLGVPEHARHRESYAMESEWV